LILLFEELRALGYEGGYDAIRRYAQSWSREHASQMVFDAHERARGLQKKCDQFALAMHVRLDKRRISTDCAPYPGKSSNSRAAITGEAPRAM
jgi:hypothetical protein